MALKSTLRGLFGKAKQSAEETAEKAKPVMEKAKETAGETIEWARRTAASAAAAVSHKAADLAEKLDEDGTGSAATNKEAATDEEND